MTSVDDSEAMLAFAPVLPVATLVLLSATLLGAVRSIVTATLLEAALTLPAASVALAVSVCAPSLNVDDVMLQLPEPFAVAVPSTVVPSVSYRLTVLFASAVPVTAGVAVLVTLDVLKLSDVGALGAATSKV